LQIAGEKIIIKEIDFYHIEKIAMISEDRLQIQIKGETMEETLIMILLKNKETGFLEKELGSYQIEDAEGYVYQTYAMEQEEGLMVYLKLTCGKEVEDWEYQAVFDYYDEEILLPLVSFVEEDIERYDPTWTIGFPFMENRKQMEEKISRLLRIHKKEILSVFEAIVDKKDDYIEE